MPAKAPLLYPPQAQLLTALGERLRAARLRRGFSAEAVCARADISRPTPSKVENGDAAVTMGNYVQVLRVLGLEQDLSAVAADDVLGRRLQDEQLPTTPRQRAPRRFFTSAMTLLNKTEQDEASYLNLAEFLATRGSDAHLAQDLRQLFRRVVFNVATAHRGDHLRNHGFVRHPRGWRLAPAYDMNPSTKRDARVLALDDRDASPSLATVLQTAAFYRLSSTQARHDCESVLTVLPTWPQRARQLGLSAEDKAELEDALVLEVG